MGKVQLVETKIASLDRARRALSISAEKEVIYGYSGQKGFTFFLGHDSTVFFDLRNKCKTKKNNYLKKHNILNNR